MSQLYKIKLREFNTINLTELNAKASYLKRIDTKYLLNGSQFNEILEELQENYRVLEIKGRKIFSYDNVYMDTDDYLFYNQHQEGKRSRTKVRTRYYVDSDLAFFEYKQKIDGITSKYRYEFPSEEHGFMTKGKKRFFEGVWQSMYYGEETPKICPSIRTKYKRITLVSKDGSERLTIDFDVKTLDLRGRNTEEIDLTNLVIIESKTLKQKSICSEMMEHHGIEKAKSCSKYSLGVVYSGLAQKYDTFKETIEKIKEIRMETLKNRKRVKNIIKGKIKEDKKEIVKK